MIIKVVNENTQEEIQSEEVDDEKHAAEVVQEMESRMQREGWMGGMLHGTEADAMFIRGAAGGEFEAVHAYLEDDDDEDSEESED